MLKILRKNKIDITGHDVKPKENFLQIKNQFIEDKYSFFDQNEIIISAVRDIEQTWKYVKERMVYLILK